MSDSSIRQTIVSQAEALGPVLHASVATSLAAARLRMRGLEHARFPHLLPLTMRAEARDELEREPLPNGWKVGGDSRLMGQLLLCNSSLGMEMRFVKERRRSYPNGVPVAGRNPARRQMWSNDPLDFEIPSSNFLAPELVPLLLCWDFRKGNLDEFTLRIVHTLAPGVYGKAVPVDLIVDVRDGGTIFSHLTFPGSPDDEDFFQVDVAEDENGS